MNSTCIDLFAGCGGLSLGLGKAGFRTKFAIEQHADAFQTYRTNLLDRKGSTHDWPEWLPKMAWSGEAVLREFGENLKALRGRVDLIAGGPPCQGFSLNGLRNQTDPRNNMIGVYLNYVEIIRPRLVLLENVVGITSMMHEGEETYSEHIKTRLTELGYDCWDSVLQAADWGVPQFRRRFVIIAALKGFLPGINPMERLRVSRRAFLTERSLEPSITGTGAALSDLESGDEDLRPDPEWGNRGFKALTRSSPSQSPYQKLMRKGTRTQPTDMRLPRHSAVVTSRMQNILKTCARGVSLRPADRGRLGIAKRSTTPLDPDQPSPTISTMPDDFIHYLEPRTMTVREHARLQSFPDWFSFKGPYTTGGERRKNACPRYTQVGNAVPPLLAEALGETLLGLLRVNQITYPANGGDVGGELPSDIREVRDRDLLTTF